MSKKSKIMPEINENFYDYNIEDIIAISNFIKMHHYSALELNKLVLEHCKDNFIKDDIFKIFEEATTMVASIMKNSTEKIFSRDRW